MFVTDAHYSIARKAEKFEAGPAEFEWLSDFETLLMERSEGTESEDLLKPKSETEAIVRHFAADYLPEEAIKIARVAHIGELLYHDKQGSAIRNDLRMALYSADELPKNFRYIEAIVTDLPVIAQFARDHDQACEDKGHTFVNIEGLVHIAENTNLESIIIKAALDYSNFELLEQKNNLSEKEYRKMLRIVTTIKTIDAPLLELTGFDALATELLSKAYTWELRQSGDEHFVDESKAIFDHLGGRNELASLTEAVLHELFPDDQLSHRQVTRDQESYEIYFTDGITTLPDTNTEYRVLTRLKSIGATAKKMSRTFAKTGVVKSPTDIVGLTLIGADNDSIEHSIQYVMDQLPKNAVFNHTPNRSEILHVKGTAEFVETFVRENGILKQSGLSIKEETCDNGYEAVKFAFLYPIDDVMVPVEVQFTHESSRRESRVGLASHTLFKLTKLMGHAAHKPAQFDDANLTDQLLRISQRKELIRKDRYVVTSQSEKRIEAFERPDMDSKAHLASIALNL